MLLSLSFAPLVCPRLPGVRGGLLGSALSSIGVWEGLELHPELRGVAASQGSCCPWL